MKNDSKLSMACWGGCEHGTCMRIFAAPLASWAQCYLGSREKGKGYSWCEQKCHTRECLQVVQSLYIWFCFLPGCEKAKPCLAGLDSRIPEFWILFCSKWEPLKSSPVKCYSWLDRKGLWWWGVCFFLHCFPLLLGSSVYQTSSLNVPTFLIPLCLC